MSRLVTLIVVTVFLSVATGDELTACDNRECSCSEYRGGGAKSIRCPDIVNCTVNIDYKKSELLEVQCLSNSSFVDELRFNFGEVKIVHVQDCKFPRGLNIFERWNLTGVKEVMLKRIFDLGTDGVIDDNFFDKTPKESIEMLYIKSSSVKAITERAFVGFDKLTRLDFEDNALTVVPDIFKHIPLLRELDLQQNLIRSLPNGITAPNLKVLYLNINNLTSLDETLFKNTPNLALLELSANRINNLPQNLLRPLKQLHSVNFGLGGNVDIRDLFEENNELRVVRFRGGNITSISPGAFRNLPNLQMVFIYDSKLRELPKDLFKSNENIESILLSENALTELPEGIFGSLNKLTKLDLSNNKLTEWKKEHFRNGLKSLEQLKLNGNKLERISNLAFTDLPKLKTLSLTNNRIREISREAFDRQSTITQLSLNVNELDNDDDDSFNFLTNLATLELNNNSYDSIPDINHIPSLKMLAMRNNKIDVIKLTDIVLIDKVDVTGNRIERVEDFIFFNMSTINETRSKPRVLLLNNNPFSCDCTAYHFFEWIRKDNPKLQIVVDKLNCTSPPRLKLKSVRDVTSNDLRCDLRGTSKYECPEECSCGLHPASMTLLVDCSYLNLTAPPEISGFKSFYEADVFYKHYYVNLSGNEITEFGEKLNYINVTGLDLSRNGLKDIKWAPQNLKILELHTNKLSHISDDVLANLVNSTLLQTLTIHGNPWNCDCSLVNLTNAVRVGFRHLLRDMEKIQCEDGQPLIHQTEAELCKEDQTIIIALCIIFGLFLIAFTVTLIFYYKYETTVKVWLFSHNVLLWFITEEEIDKNKKFDAFVSYSHKDETFVEQNLVPELEDGPVPYKVCYHERDWEVGEFINKQIIDSVNNSRRTIIVLSKHFLESTWAPVEFRTAHTHAMTEKRNRLIVILYDDVKPDDVKDEELRAYLKTNTYIKWGDPWFWKKLRYAMPHRNFKSDEKTEKAKQRIENIMISIDDKLDLTTTPSTPNTQTPPAMSLDPLLLKVSPLEFKTEKNENKIISTQIC